jgi:hypothetical protein
MNRQSILGVVLLVVLLLGGALAVGAGWAAGGQTLYLPGVFGAAANLGGHETISAYTGPETCVACHRNEAEAMHGSVHYQLSGPTPNVPNIPGDAGKGQGGMNTYCGAIVTSRDVTCAGCHTSYGQQPTAEMTPAQLANIDCLMCHQINYARKAAGPYESVPAVGQDGQPRTLTLPVEDANGFHFMPDEAKMTISLVEAARTAGPTTRATCLRCHANAAGSDGAKRGDLSSVTVNPPRSSDIHMSPQGEDFTCATCHDAGDHRVSGRGLDLRPNDTPEPTTCESCHGDRPHDDYNARDGESRDVHAGHVACQTCHIPTFAKDVSTELARDWLEPEWWPGAFGGQGGWKPGEVRAMNVIPAYRWFDGTSEVYLLGQAPAQNAAGEYEFGLPLGNVASPGAKIYPMKEHRSISARHDATGQMIPHSTELYFRTGDFAQAVQSGMVQAGLTGGYTLVPVHTFQTINHGVEGHESALQCQACHSDTHGDDDRAAAAPRMDLPGELGYGLKGSQPAVCTQCHEPEDPEGFREMHDKHVKDEGYDCGWCHTFSREERGLERP